MKFLRILFISLIVAGCTSSENELKDPEEMYVYAENLIWTFDKLPVFVNVEKGSVKPGKKYLKAELNEKKEPVKITWEVAGVVLKMLSVGEEVYEISFEHTGLKMIQRYLDQNGEQTDDFFGICKIVTEFDSFGNKITEQYFDKYDKPARDDFGNFKYVFYEGDNDLQKYSYSKEVSKDVQTEDIIDEIHYRLDQNGVVIKTARKGNVQKKTNHTLNYISSEFDYDENYRLKKISFFDENDRLCKSNYKNSAMISFFYNDDAQQAYLVYLNIDSTEIYDPKCRCSVKRNFLPPSGDINYFYSIRELKD